LNWVVVFEATSHALRAERILKKAGLKVFAIPTPRHLSANCGIAFRFSESLRFQVEKSLREAGCPFEGIYPLEERG
jgi:uncharacterized SAM-binding protein YcdF (DUF218 family)